MDIADTSREALRVATETGLITERVQLVYKTILHLGTPVGNEIDHYTQKHYGFSGAWKAVSELKDRGALKFGKKRRSKYSNYRGHECILTGIIGKQTPRIFPPGFERSIDAIIRRMDDVGLRDVNRAGLLTLKKEAANELKRRKASTVC